MQGIVLYELENGKFDKKSFKAFLLSINSELWKTENAEILEESLHLASVVSRYTSFTIYHELESEPILKPGSAVAFGADKDGGWYAITIKGNEYGGVLYALWTLMEWVCSYHLKGTRNEPDALKSISQQLPDNVH